MQWWAEYLGDLKSSFNYSFLTRRGKMKINRESAARRAAAMYSTNPMLAIFKYAELLGQLTLQLSGEGLVRMEEEMLSLLMPYRHPMADQFGEYMAFIDPDCLAMNGTIYSDPPFSNKLKDAGIDEELLIEIKEYSKNYQLKEIEFNVCKEELEKLRAKFTEAQEVYAENNNERSEKRNALVVQVLGLSTGHVPKRIDEKEAYVDYVKLVRRQGMCRREAVEEVQSKHDINSYDATLKILHDYRSSFFKKWKESHPSTLPQIRSRLKGFIPSRR